LRVKRKAAWLAALLLAVLTVAAGCGTLKESAAASTKDFAQTTVETLSKTTAAPKTVEDLPAATVAPETAKDLSSATAERKKTEAPVKIPTEESGQITDPQAIADYIFAHGELPDNFITKEEAKALGWDSKRNYVGDVAPGKSIGGDRYGNYEGKLPKAKGRKFYECDVNYRGKKRGAERIVYSNDGHVWYTKDHYETFEELFPSDR